MRKSVIIGLLVLVVVSSGCASLDNSQSSEERELIKEKVELELKVAQMDSQLAEAEKGTEKPEIDSTSTTTQTPKTSPPATTLPLETQLPTTSTTTTTTQQHLDILRISFDDFDELFNPDVYGKNLGVVEKDILKEEKDKLFETEYEGKIVRWEGIVDDEIRKGFLDDYCMEVRAIDSNTVDFQVCYEKDVREKLLTIEQGDRVIITAELESIHGFYPDYDLNGIDIEEVGSSYKETTPTTSTSIMTTTTTSTTTTTTQPKEIAYLDFGFGTFIDNWDADADDDGIKTTIYPHSSDDGDVKLDATVIFTLYQKKTEINPVTYEIEEKTIKLQEWEKTITKDEGGLFGIDVRLEFNSNTENIVNNEDFFIGEIRAKLLTLDGKTFEAKTDVI